MEVNITWEYDNFKSIGWEQGLEAVANHALSIGRDTLATMRGN
jgi:hypothetical protein